MKTKILKNKITIDMSVSEYDTLFKYIGKVILDIELLFFNKLVTLSL